MNTEEVLEILEMSKSWMSSKEITKESDLCYGSSCKALNKLWKNNLILRAKVNSSKHSAFYYIWKIKETPEKRN